MVEPAENLGSWLLEKLAELLEDEEGPTGGDLTPLLVRVTSLDNKYYQCQVVSTLSGYMASKSSPARYLRVLAGEAVPPCPRPLSL